MSLQTLATLCLGLALSCWAQAEGLLAIDNPASNGQSTGAYTTVDAFAGNDQVAISQYVGNWQGDYTPRSGTNLGVVATRAETGVQWQGYRLGGLYRADALVQSNRDTSDLVRQYLTSSGYDTGRNYQLAYQLTGFEAKGVRLSKSFQRALDSGPWQVDLGLGLAYLRGQSVKLQTASGQVMTVNTKDISANASMTTADSRTNVADVNNFNAPYGRLFTPSGEGYAVDVGMVLRHTSGLGIEVAVADAAGVMNWKNLPTNVETYNTANKYIDANGFAQFNPTATRTSSYQNLTQTLDPKLWLAANYPLGDFRVQAAASAISGYWFPEVSVNYRVTPAWQLAAQYDTYFNTFGFAIQHQWFTLGVRTDNLNLDNAKAFGLRVGVQIPF